jgi:hypothetical protein
MREEPICSILRQNRNLNSISQTSHSKWERRSSGQASRTDSAYFGPHSMPVYHQSGLVSSNGVLEEAKETNAER